MGLETSRRSFKSWRWCGSTWQGMVVATIGALRPLAIFELSFAVTLLMRLLSLRLPVDIAKRILSRVFCRLPSRPRRAVKLQERVAYCKAWMMPCKQPRSLLRCCNLRASTVPVEMAA